MPAGSRYAGVPIDASTRRSIELVADPSNAQPASVLDDDSVSETTVDYFYDAGRFWRAVIPLDSVEQVFGHAFNFSKPRTRKGQHGPEIVYGKTGEPKRTIPCLYHVQSRLKLKPDRPIRLYPLGEDTRGAADATVDDLVYSVEAVGPVGVNFNLRDGMSGSLLSAHRFLSTQEMVFERIAVENQYVSESPPLPLDDRQKRALLIASLRRGHKARMSEAYYLFRVCGTNNCTSNPLQILDTVIDYRGPRRIAATLYRLPISPRLYLRLRGLDRDPSQHKLLRDEFDQFIRDPATQARKRQWVRQMIAARRASPEADRQGPEAD